MKTSVTVIVLKPFDQHGVSYAPGERIALSPIDAVVLSRKRLVTLTKRKPVPGPEPVAPPPEPEPEIPKARRVYRRRDVQPEQEERTVMEPDE